MRARRVFGALAVAAGGVLASTLASGLAPALAADQSFQGYARDLRSGQLLYIESHFVKALGTPGERRVVLYRCVKGDSSVAGEPFGRKELSYEHERDAPDFSYLDARFGHLEGLRHSGSALEVFDRERSGAATRTSRLAPGLALVADAGFDEYVKGHWNELEAGETVRFPFLVPSRLDVLTFKVNKHGETQIEGATASVIRLNLSGFLGWFLPYIEVSYRKSDRLLMRYKGLTNVWDARGNNLSAQIDLPAADRHEAEVDLEAARAEPLVSRCP